MKKNTAIAVLVTLSLGAGLWAHFLDQDVPIKTKRPPTPRLAWIAHTTQEPDIHQAGNGLVGSWQSLDDAHLTIEYLPDGTLYEYYRGALHQKTSWEFITRKKGDSRSILYLKTSKKLCGTEQDASEYLLIILTDTDLVLDFFDRSNKLRYKKIPDEETSQNVSD